MKRSDLKIGTVYTNRNDKQRKMISIAGGKVKYNKIEYGEEVGFSKTVGADWFIRWITER